MDENKNVDINDVKENKVSEVKKKTAKLADNFDEGFSKAPPDKDIKIKVTWKLILGMIVGGLIVGSSIALIWKDFVFAGEMFLLTPLLIYLSAVDIKLQMAPDWGAYVTAALSLPSVAYHVIKHNYGGLIEMGFGLLLCFLPLLIAAMISHGGIGGADIKLMSAAGLLLGIHRAFLALVIGLLIFVIVNAIRIKTGKVERKQKTALIPFLTVGIVLAAVIIN